MSDEQQTEFQQALSHVVESPEGRLVIKSLLDSCGVEVSVWNKEEAVRDFYLGRQSIGMQLAQEIRNLGPRAWIQFLNNLEDDNERRANQSK